MPQMQTSIAERLRFVHKKLLDDLRGLEDVTRPESKLALAEIQARLAAARKDVNEHFNFEEQNGYMDNVRANEPRLDGVIQELIDEHRQLRQSLDGIIETAQSMTDVEPRFRNDIRQWVKQVRQHEAHENDLFQEAFNVDLHAGD